MMNPGSTENADQVPAHLQVLDYLEYLSLMRGSKALALAPDSVSSESSLTSGLGNPVQTGGDSAVAGDLHFSDDAFNRVERLKEASAPWIFIGPLGAEPLAQNETLRKLIQALKAEPAFVLEFSEEDFSLWLKGLKSSEATDSESVFPVGSRVVSFSESYARELGGVWKGKLISLEHPVLMANNRESKKRAWVILKTWMDVPAFAVGDKASSAGEGA